MATLIGKRSFFFLSLLFFFGSALRCDTTIIFDLGGVLVQNDSWAIAKNVGLGSLFKMLIFDRRNPAHLNRDFFNLLEEFFGEQRNNADSECAYGNGFPLPQVMCDWLAGIYSGPEIAARTCTYLDQLSSKRMSKREKRIFKNLAWAVFDPHVLAEVTHPVAEGVELLKDCVQAGNRVILLSNFDPDGFIEIYNKPEMRELFDLIPVENIVVSGFVGMIKPHADIFDYTIKTYNIDPHFCTFIDDQEENCCMARKKGIRAVQFNKKVIKKIRRSLQFRTILPT